MVPAEAAALRAVVKRHDFKPRIAHCSKDVADAAAIGRRHEHSARQPLRLQRAVGKHIKAGFVGIGDLHVLRKHLQAVERRSPRRGDGGDALIALFGDKAGRRGGAGHLHRLGVGQMLRTPRGALRQALSVGTDGFDVLNRRPGHPHQGLADGQHHLAHDIGMLCRDQRIHIIDHCAAHGVLLGDDGEISVAKKHVRNGVVHRRPRVQRLSGAEPEPCGFLGIGALRPEITDLYGVSTLGEGGSGKQQKQQQNGQ